MNVPSFSALFGGEAGYGVMSAGAMLAKAATRKGLFAFVENEYPSLIKGGLNNCMVRLASSSFATSEAETDVLGAISQQALEINAFKVKSGGMVFYDVSAVKPEGVKLASGVRLVPVKLIQEGPGELAKVMANSAVLGSFCALSGFPPEAILDVMKSEFTNPAIFGKNFELFNATYEQVKVEHGPSETFPISFATALVPRMLLNGNDAIAMGAVKAGCRFAAGYPMTPATGILAYISDHALEYGLVFKQSEDEIAAINMLIGAGYAGVRALGATSGGGFSLMCETLGFAAQAEVPLVIIMAQRGGPSTGLPTRTMQGDLNQVLYASQGEFARVVVMPGDVDECFYETFRAFNLAEKYQLPCLVLTDKFLADSSITCPFFEVSHLMIDRGKLVDETWLEANQPYLRYRQNPDGVSERALPVQSGGRHIASSYTHGEDGFYSSGNKEYAAMEPTVTAAGIGKSFAKLPQLLAEVPGVKLHGQESADLTIVAWGSTKGAVLEAVALAKADGLQVNFLQVLYASPFPAEQTAAILAKSKRILLVEGNKTAQLGALLRSQTGFVPTVMYLKYDSRPFTTVGILSRIKEAIAQ